MTTQHIAIVGAGFAGLTAARELEMLGLETTIFEARDRIGGRAWTDTRMGIPLEMGATWVHWYQPHIWSEITRYKQGIYPSPHAEKAYWMADGQIHEGTEEEATAEQHRVEAVILKDSREFFPDPYNPTGLLEDAGASEAVKERFIAADHRSVLDILSDTGASTADLDLADSYWSAAFQAPARTGSSLMALHQSALNDHRMSLLDDTALGFKLENGMKGLYEGIASDVSGPIELGKPVAAVQVDGDVVTLSFEDGADARFDAVIVTVPTAALRGMNFTPALTVGQAALVREGSASSGVKAWIKVRGQHRVSLTAPSQHPLTVARTEYVGDDWSILVGFGPDSTAIDLTSVESAQSAIDVWGLDLEVIDVTGHDWMGDKWSRQTWATPKLGQFIGGKPHFQDRDGRLRFAGSDWAKGWTGVFVDGAIESGISTARDLARELRVGQG